MLARRLYGLILLCVAGLATPGAHAHFGHNYERLLVNLEHREDGIAVFARMPMGLAVVNAKLRGWIHQDEFPFSRQVVENGQPMFYVDDGAIRDHPDVLGAVLAQTIRLWADASPGQLGRELKIEFKRLLVRPVEDAPPFDSPDAARSALDGDSGASPVATTYVGDSIVDVEFFVSEPGYLSNLRFAEAVSDMLALRYKVTVLLNYVRAGTQRTYNYGDITAPALIIRPENSRLDAAWTFFKHGVVHILEGVDHVLLVIVLVLGAMSLIDLAWLVTGFTVGHSITLAVGTLGWVPSASWFVPAVEMAIALTIVASSLWVALRQRLGHGFLTAGLIGLVHGFGFAFVLGQLLPRETAQLINSLVAFNVGVEAGQLGIVLLAWSVLQLLRGFTPRHLHITRGIVWLVAAQAAYWTIVRSHDLYSQLGG